MNNPWEILKIENHKGPKGSLSVVELSENMPFMPLRFFWVTQVPAGAARGFHAHKSGQQVLFCLHGKILARVDNGSTSQEVTLEAGGSGLWMKNEVWGEQVFLEPDSVLLVLASNEYDESDYIRDRAEFEELVRQGK